VELYNLTNCILPWTLETTFTMHACRCWLFTPYCYCECWESEWLNSWCKSNLEHNSTTWVCGICSEQVAVGV